MTSAVVTFILLGSVALIAAVLILEIHHPEAKLTIALRSWQTGIAAVFGLASIAISVAMQTYEADRLQRAQVRREGMALAMSMQQEALQIFLWLHRIERIVRDEEAKVSEAKDDRDRRFLCELAIGRVKRPHYNDLGIIDANRSSLGKMPLMTGIQFVGLASSQRDLLQRIEKSECHKGEAFEVKLTFNVLKEGMGNVRRSLRDVEKNLTSLPGTQPMRVLFTASEE